MAGWKIYALKDPRDGDIRYIGRTRDERKRYQLHVAPSQLTNSHKSRWIRQLLSLGLSPILEILEVDVPDSAASERAWISRLRDSGHRLTNSTDGGDGACGMKVSAETRAKLSAARAHVVYTDTWRANLSAGLKGRTVSPETRGLISQSQKGKPHSREHVAKSMAGWTKESRQRAGQLTRERMTGVKQSADSIAKRNAKLRGLKRTPEQRARISASRKGIIFSDEARRNMGAAQRRRAPCSDETRAKIVSALTGRPVSEATRSKMRSSALRREACKRSNLSVGTTIL